MNEKAVELFLANQRLVGFVVHKFFASSPPDLQAEMLEEGRPYLWQAAQTHDPTKGTFATWAVLLIRHGIIRWLNSTKTARRMQAETVSLDAPVGGEEEDLFLKDILPGPDNTEREVETREVLMAASRSRVGRLTAKGLGAYRIAKKLKRSLGKVKAERERLRAFAKGEPLPAKPPPAKQLPHPKAPSVKRPKKERDRRDPSPEMEKVVHDLLASLGPSKEAPPLDRLWASVDGR